LLIEKEHEIISPYTYYLIKERYLAMTKLILILAVSFGGLLAGYLFKLLCEYYGLLNFEKLNLLSGNLKTIALLFMYPIAIINSFWKLSISDVSFLILPIIGLIPLLLGSTSAHFLSRKFKILPSKSASIYISGMCTNQGSFGGLLAFFLLGDQGYFYLQLFIILEIVLYYILGFPVSSDISKGSTRLLHFNFQTLTEKPVSLIPIAAIFAGILLNSTHIYHPSFMDTVAAFFIPATTAANCLAIGMTLQLGTVKDYYKEISLVFIAKYLINPMIVLPLTYILVIKGVITLLAFKVLVILVFMPVGFTALLAPILYNFDLDLSNSIWITTTLTSLFVFIPVLYLILS